MNDNLVASLFNRAILDAIVGFLTLVISDLLFALLTGVDLVLWLLSSPYAGYAIWLFLIVSFLFGHLVDKIAFLLFDHTVFAKHFQTRLSTFDLPEWCQSAIEQRVSSPIAVTPTKSRDLVDDSKADWITAYFLTKARPEAIQKRADLIANFQFVSNLLLVLIFALLVVPIYLYSRVTSSGYAIVSAFILFVGAIAYWRFSLASLARIHTFENLVVYGFLIEEKIQEAKRLAASQAQAQEPSRTQEGVLKQLWIILFGEQQSI